MSEQSSSAPAQGGTSQQNTAQPPQTPPVPELDPYDEEELDTVFSTLEQKS